METYALNKDIKIFGFEVKTFPEGVGEAFDALARTLPEGLNRPYYGISYADEQGRIIYHVMASEKYAGEANQYQYEHRVIVKGQYVAVKVLDWYSKLDSIKDIFHNLMQDSRIDKTKPCVEWYKSDDEMICMMKML